MKEMESLNIDDLDVEELERRLELAPTGPGSPAPVPTCDPDICGGDIVIICTKNCTADMSWRC